MHDQVATTRFLVHDDADVRHAATQIPGYEIAGRIVFGAAGNGQSLPFSLEKHREIWDSPVIDVGIRASKKPSLSVRVGSEIVQHIFVDFSLQIDTHGPVRTDDLVCTHAGIGRNVSARIRDADVGGNVSDRMMGALDRSRNQAVQEFLMRVWIAGSGLCDGEFQHSRE